MEHPAGVVPQRLRVAELAGEPGEQPGAVTADDRFHPPQMDQQVGVELFVLDEVGAVVDPHVVRVQHPHRRFRGAGLRPVTAPTRSRHRTRTPTSTTASRSPSTTSGCRPPRPVTRPGRRTAALAGRRARRGDGSTSRPRITRHGNAANVSTTSDVARATAGIDAHPVHGSAPGIGCPNGPPPVPSPFGPSHYSHGCSTSHPSGEFSRTSRPSVARSRFVVNCRNANRPAAAVDRNVTGRCLRAGLATLDATAASSSAASPRPAASPNTTVPSVGLDVGDAGLVETGARSTTEPLCGTCHSAPVCTIGHSCTCDGQKIAGTSTRRRRRVARHHAIRAARAASTGRPIIGRRQPQRPVRCVPGHRLPRRARPAADDDRGRPGPRRSPAATPSTT